MSHVTKIALKITDLDALEAALKHMGGLELRRGQTTYKWYGQSVGDYPLPEGITEADLGKCDHAIVQTKKLALNYEVGLVKEKDGTGYRILFDFYDERLAKALGGNEAHGLKREYAAAVATKQFYSQGYRVSRAINSRGEIVLEASN